MQQKSVFFCGSCRRFLLGFHLDAGKELGVPLPLTAVTQQMFQAAVSAGYGEDDFCSAIKVLEAWAGVEVKKP